MLPKKKKIVDQGEDASALLEEATGNERD